MSDKPALDPMCQCPKCGRMHKHLQAGTPPMAIAGPSLLRKAESTAPYVEIERLRAVNAALMERLEALVSAQNEGPEDRVEREMAKARAALKRMR